MGTFDELSIGERLISPARALTDEDVAELIRLGGYTHPLFTDPDFAARSPFGMTPLPGEGILHVMGGLVEQTNRFDDTVIALVGMDEVAFSKPAFGGDSLRVEIEVVKKAEAGGGRRGLLTMRWRCVNQDDDELVALLVTMLFRVTSSS